MKTKHLVILFSVILSFGHSVICSAAVPLRWDVDTSRLAPVAFDAVRGETLALEATFQSSGKPFAMDADPVSIFWQTNGMGNAWWTAPAAAESNRVAATFTPEMDPGAATVIGFLGSSGSVYRAAFTFRFRHGPGAVPNVIELPPRVLDLEHTVVINPPWPTDETIDARIRQVIDEDHIVAPVETNVVTGIISNTVNKAFVENLGISGGGGGGGSVDTNAVRDIVNPMICAATNGVNAAIVESIDEALTANEKEGTEQQIVRGYLYGGTWYIGTSYAQRSGYAEEASRAYRADSDRLDRDIPITYATKEELAAKHDALETNTYTKAEVDGLVEDAGKVKTVAGQEPDASGNVSLSPSTIGAATQEEVNAAMTAANEANVWSSAVYNFMTGGRTNCWFSGTNYVFGTDAVARTRFAWEDGMDAATVPCSMALWEIRDGERQLVWDQRDWTAWYWSFKASQMQADVTAQINALGNSVTNASNYAWSKRYASDGTPNPDPSTTFIDTPSVTLSPGMKWETVATVAGAAYWTIVGDGALIGGSGTNAVLRIQDFEGNDIMTVTKGEHSLAWVERGEITGQSYDEDGWVCFDMLADSEPIGYFSTTLDSSDFLLQTDPNCPAQYEWEDLHNGKYRIHYLLKPGIQSNTCFAKFQVEVEGQTIIRYNAGQEISGGLIYNGVKIAPDISGSPAVGTVIQWKVGH